MANLRMRLSFAVLLGCLAACGTEPDERPATFEVVTLSVLAPTCGQVQCHSTTTRIQGLAFDTLEAARPSLREIVNVSQGGGEIIEVLTEDGEDRMPPDAPLAAKDIALIQTWIDAGAPGL